MKIVSTPDLNIGTTFTILSSVGNTPVWNDRLLMCVEGILILCLINSIIRGFSSSRPDELSFKLSIIFSISVSVTDDTTNKTVLLVMYSGGFFFVGGIALARVDPTLTKNPVEFIGYFKPIAYNLAIRLKCCTYRGVFFLFMTIFSICQDF